MYLRQSRTLVNQAQMIQQMNKKNPGGAGDHLFKHNLKIQLFLMSITQLSHKILLVLLMPITQLTYRTLLVPLIAHKIVQAQMILQTIIHQLMSHQLMIQTQMMKIGTMMMKKMILEMKKMMFGHVELL